jgi:hypothetical protein
MRYFVASEDRTVVPSHTTRIGRFLRLAGRPAPAGTIHAVSPESPTRTVCGLDVQQRGLIAWTQLTWGGLFVRGRCSDCVAGSAPGLEEPRAASSG